MPPKATKADALRGQRRFSVVEPHEWLVGSEIWVPSPNDEVLFDKAHVKSIAGTDVICDVNGEQKKFSLRECRNVNARVDPLLVQDLSKLTHVNDAAVLDFLRVRYINDQIYTYAAQLLVAVNPFRSLPGIYEVSNIRRYQQAVDSVGFPSDLPPHTYAIAQKAVSLFHNKKQNQSCIVSGESGAGKTETARQLMQFFAHNDQVQESGGLVQDIILGSNPLLESFGNAKTLRNNNSSRFGRFIKLGIRHGGGITAGEISQYMLELSRIDVQQKGERNYHIFYQICRHLPPDMTEKCKIRDIKFYNFLNRSGTYEVETVDDAAESKDVQSVLKSVMSPAEVEGLYAAISGVLLCGNLGFINTAKRGTDEAAETSTGVELTDVAELLGVPRDKLEFLLTVKSTEIQGQVVESAISAKDALGVCHTLGKEVYSTIFDWLVQTVNSKIKGPAGGLNDRWVGILDIYGFEYFENNSFEQFLINYANEKLQQFFVQNVFRAEIAEYEAEGIDHSMIVYEDNSDVISLVEDKKRSILAFLEEQCSLGTGTSSKFTVSCHQAFEKDPLYVKPRGDAKETFGINHTAAPVMYNTEAFVSKNKLRMPNELIILLKASTNAAIKSALSGVEIADTRSMKGKFVGSKFVSSMDKLLGVLRQSTAHFIRCIKPNQIKQPRVYTNSDVLGQLHCLSILEAVSIVQKGFAYRSSFEDFIKDNQVLIGLIGGDVTGNPVEITRTVLGRLKIPDNQWQAGKSRIFIRKEGWLLLDQFFKKAMLTIKPLINRIQAAYQSHLLRKRYMDRIRMRIRIQSMLRRYSVVKVEARRKEILNLVLGGVYFMKFVGIRQQRMEAALVIQKHARRYIVQKKFSKQIREMRKVRFDAALVRWARAFMVSQKWKQMVLTTKQRRATLKIQKVWRGHRVRRFVRRYKKWKILNRAATKIQAFFRGYRVRKVSRVLRWLTPYVITIQRFWRGYKVRCGPHMQPLRHILEKIRRSQEERQALTRLTAFCRTYLVQQRLERVVQAAFILQALALPQILRKQMDRISEAALAIQSWWRGDRIRRIIKEEKVKILLTFNSYAVAEQANHECDIAKRLRRETVQLEKKAKRTRGSPIAYPRLQLVQVTVGLETPTVYPHGWGAGLLKLRQISPNAGIESVACGAFHTVILTGAGYIYSYGLNDKGQLGVEGIRGRAEPESPLLFPFKITVKQIQCGADHTLLLAHEGHVFAWGSNERAGSFHSAAVSGGSVWVWGRGDHLCLRGVSHDVPTPVVISDREVIETIGDVCRVECGLACTFLLNDFGEVFVFGNSTSPCLGLGPGVSKFFLPVKLPALQDIVDIRVGVNFVMAVNVDGGLWQWGTVLEWDPCILQATKVTLCEPMKINPDAFDNERVEECAVGWWEATVRTNKSRILGWNVFRYCGKSNLQPHVYGFDLMANTEVTRLEVVSCPALTAVLCETGSKSTKSRI